LPDAVEYKFDSNPKYELVDESSDKDLMKKAAEADSADSSVSESLSESEVIANDEE